MRNIFQVFLKPPNKFSSVLACQDRKPEMIIIPPTDKF